MAQRLQSTFRVSERILHVETVLESPPRVETMAFPVDNIARVAMIPHRPNYARALLEFLVGFVVVGLLAAVVAERLVGVAAVLAVVLTIRLLAIVTRRPYYVLLVETTGPPVASAFSRDEAQVRLIGQNIIAAINNPHATFQYTIENYHVGDKIKLVGGSGNIGKVSR